MQINRIYARDFLSYATLDLCLDNLGLVLIDGENRDAGGSNGAGKSSIFEAIVWCVFGKTTKRTRGADDVIREDASHKPIHGETMASIDITIADRHVQIFRYREHSKWGNKVLLFVDGNELTAASDRETQAVIDQILAIDHVAFTAAVMFPQGGESFIELTDSSQKMILDRVLGTERFQVALDKTKAMLLATENEYRSQKATHDMITGQDFRLREQIRLTDKEQDEFMRVKANDMAYRASVIETMRANPIVVDESLIEAVHNDDVTAQDKTLAELNNKLAQLTEERMSLNAQIGEVKTNRHVLAGTSEPLPNLQPVSAPEKTQDEYHREGIYVNSQIQSTSEQISQLRGRLAEIESRKVAASTQTNCHVCGSDLTDASRIMIFGNVEEELEESKRRIIGLDATLKQLESRRAELQQLYKQARDYEQYARIESIREQVESFERLLVDLQNADLQTQNEVSSVNSQIQSIMEARKAINAARLKLEQQQRLVDNYKHELDKAIAHHQEAVNRVSPFARVLENFKKELSELSAKKITLDASVRILDSDIKKLKYWERGFGNEGIKSIVLSHIVPTLSRNTNEYLDIISAGAARVEFDTQKKLMSGEKRDKFDVRVTYNCGGGDVKKISGGEARRISLATMFALGDISAERAHAPIRLRLLDEPFDGLDMVGAEQVITALEKKVLPKCGTVLVMSHDDHLRSLISKRLTVVKENGVSTVV